MSREQRARTTGTTPNPAEEERTVMAALAQIIVLVGVKNGLDPEQLCAASGISTREIADRDRQIPHRWYAQIRGSLIAHLPQLSIGLELGRCASPEHFGYLGQALKYCATGRDLFRLLVRALVLLDSLRQHLPPRLTVSAESVMLDLPPLPCTDLDPPECTEGVFAALIHTLPALLNKPVKPVQVRFAHAREDGLRAQFEREFGCEVRFNCGEHVLVLDRGILDQPLSAADSSAFRHFERQLEKQLDERHEPFVTLVARAVEASLAFGEVSQEAIARKLGLSTRSLQRRLQEQGKSYNELLAQTRQDLAARLLLDPGLAIYEVALALGYTDVRAFNRSFVRWTGLTPRVYREANCSAPA